MNPRAALTTYSLSRGAPSASLGISPNKNCSIVLYITRCYAYHFLNISFLHTQNCYQQLFLHTMAYKKTTRINLVVFIKRRGWDSNPRALSDKRFSRPPRYDHFDTSPSIYLSAASVSPQRQDVFYHSFSLSSTPFSNFFYFFVFFLFSCIFHL